MKSLFTIGEQFCTFNDSWERAEYADDSNSFGINFLHIEILIFGEVLNVSLVKAQFAGLLLFHVHPWSH